MASSANPPDYRAGQSTATSQKDGESSSVLNMAPHGDTEKMGTEMIEETEHQPAQTSDAEKKLVRKIDLFLMPTIWIMYLLSYMDRTNIGNARIAGMTDDLNMGSPQYSVALIVFFVSYVIFEVPSNMILSKTKPSIFLPVIMGLWGIVTCCMAVVKTYGQLVALRFVIGIFEAGFAPGILLIISSWYKKNEQSKRFGIYISAAVLSGAFGGIIAGAITSNLEGVHGFRGWEWLFLILGVATVGFSILARFLLLDFPHNTSRLTPEERELAISRLEADNVSSEEEDVPMTSFQALIRALSNWRVWIHIAGYMVIVGSSTLSYFYPTLVQGLGYSSVNAQYMLVPIYGVAFIFVGITAVVADRFPKQRGLIIAGWLFEAMVCAIAICTEYGYTARYVLLVFTATGLWAANGLGLSYASSTFGVFPRQQRGIALALVNALGNLAQIYGAYLFPNEDAPKYIMGFSVIVAMCAFGVAVYIVAHVTLRKYIATK